MCGIAGMIGKNADKNEVVEMLRAIKHRGEEAYFAEVGAGENFAIGCNRLAIADEANGAQPKKSKDGKWLAVMNGEIYNCDFLAQKLGYFENKNDTQMMLRAFEAHGSGFVSHLEGMFAFCIVDALGGRKYLLARDRFGVKPLYYCVEDDTLYFASELKALTKISRGDAELEICELKPAQMLDCGVLVDYYQQPKCWQDEARSGLQPKPQSQDQQGLQEQQLEKKLQNLSENNLQNLRNKLEEAVAKCIPSDTKKLAVLLSGGIDSSTIAMLAKRLHKGPIVAYTLANNQENSDDLKFSAQLCHELKIEHKIISPSPYEMTEFYKKFGVFVTESFEPALARNATSYYFLCKAVAADGFKFCLSGEGADEIFGGYNYMRLHEGMARDQAISDALKNIHRTYLQMADRASMFATLEVRVPYMEHYVVEAALDLPSQGRINGDVAKFALRQLYENDLPQNIRLRPKIGMNAGGGYGGNDPSESIYHQAIKEFYQKNGAQLQQDLDLAKSFKTAPSIDLDDVEQVFNLARFCEFGFDRFAAAKERLQLNTSFLIG